MTWDLFFRLFSVDIPFWYGGLVTVIAGSCSLYALRMKQANRWGWVLDSWIAACILLMLWITLFGRLTNPMSEARYNLMPLWTMGLYRQGLVELLYEKVNNVIFFVPLGGLLAWRFDNGWRAVGFGAILSMLIECMQFVTRTGFCETDDVMCNTAGCLIGWTIGTTIQLAFKRKKHRNND